MHVGVRLKAYDVQDSQSDADNAACNW